jgi:hypothetical protein
VKLNPVGPVMLVGVNTTSQLADPELAAPREQVLEPNVAVPPAELGVAVQLTLPVGTVVVPLLVSVTVT